jgi:hypothetical protein
MTSHFNPLRRATLLLLLAALPLAACRPRDEADLLPPPGYSDAEGLLASSDRVKFAGGWHDVEAGGGDAWRWMSEEGVIRLKSFGRDARLKLAGRVPLGHYPQRPTLVLRLNGEQLDSLPLGGETFEKEYVIPAAKQEAGEWAELRLAADRSFVPREVEKGSTDERRLSVALTRLQWESK